MQFQNYINKLPILNLQSQNALWLLLEQAFKMLTGFTVGIWVTRYLGPEQYGLLSYANSLTGIIGTIVPLGLIGYIVRQLVRENKNQNKILGTTFVLRLTGGICGLLVILLITLFNNQSFSANGILLIVSWQLIFQSFDTIDLFFQSRSQNIYSVLSRCIPLLLFSIIRIFIVIFDWGLISITLTYTLELLFGGFSLIYFYKKQNNTITNWKYNNELAKLYLKNTLPLIFSSFTAMLYLKVDQLMLKWIVGSSEVGIYAAAARLSEMWYFIPNILMTSLFPILIRLKERDEELYQEKIQQVLNAFVTINIIIIIFITICGDMIIKTLYGNYFDESAMILKIHIWSSMFVFIRILLNKWFIIENLLKQQFYNELIGAISNIVLNIILIPRYGGVGSAIATLISYIIAIYISSSIYPKTRKFSFMVTRSFWQGIINKDILKFFTKLK